MDTVYYPQAEVEAILMPQAGSISHATLLLRLQTLRFLSMPLRLVQRRKAICTLSI